MDTAQQSGIAPESVRIEAASFRLAHPVSVATATAAANRTVLTVVMGNSYGDGVDAAARARRLGWFYARTRSATSIKRVVPVSAKG